MNGDFSLSVDKAIEEIRKGYQQHQDLLADIRQNHEQLEKTWKEHFYPHLWPVFETCLSAACTLFIKDNRNPIGIVLIGGSGSGKTTVVNMFRKLPDNIMFYTDDFTPASFLTQAMNVNSNELEEVDLIRKIPNKLFLISDLAPLFGQRLDKVRDNLSKFTRVMDGQGLARDGGVHGHREFNERYTLVLIGATVKISNNIHKIISSLGTRILFYRMPIKSTDDEETQLLNIISRSSSFQKGVDRFQNLINDFFYIFKINSIEWPNEPNPQINRKIAKLSSLISILRFIPTGDTDNEIPREDPSRLLLQLFNIACGHAISQGRRKLDDSDFNIILNVALSSIPLNRSQCIQILIDQYPDSVTIKELVENTQFRETKLKEVLDFLISEGIIEEGEKLHQAFSYRLREDFSFLKTLTPSNSRKFAYVSI